MKVCKPRKFQLPFRMNKLFHSRTAQTDRPNAFQTFQYSALFANPTTWTSFFCLLYVVCGAEFLALKHESRILGHSSNPVCDFSMMEQVRLFDVWPMENWLDFSLNQIQGWTTVRESYSRDLEQGPLGRRRGKNGRGQYRHLF